MSVGFPVGGAVLWRGWFAHADDGLGGDVVRSSRIGADLCNKADVACRMLAAHKR